MSHTPSSSEKLQKMETGTPISPKIDTPPSTSVHPSQFLTELLTPKTETTHLSSQIQIKSGIYSTPSSPPKDKNPICSQTLVKEIPAVDVQGKKVVTESTKISKNYTARGTQKKLLSDAMAENKSKTTQKRRQRNRAVIDEEFVSEDKLIDVFKATENSEIESDDVVAAKEKRRSVAFAAKSEKCSAKPKAGKKEPKENVKRKRAETTVEPISEKGPVLGNKKRKIEHTLSKGERVKVLKTQKVLSGRVFDPDVQGKPLMRDLVNAIEIQGWTHLFEWPIPTLHEQEVSEFYYNIDIAADGGIITKVGGIMFILTEEILGEILQMPREGIASVYKVAPSQSFIIEAGKLSEMSCAGVPKKFLKGQYQLYFEFVNKVLLPRTEKRTVASSADLFLMEALSKLEAINLPAIMMEHMIKIVTVKDGKHGMGYGYLLNLVFDHFGIEVGKGIKGTIKQSFSLTTLIECECVEGRTGNKAKSQVSDLLEQQEKLKQELEEMTVTLASRDAEIARLNAQLLQAQKERLGSDAISMLKAQNDSLNAEVKNLTQQLLKAYAENNTGMTLLLQYLAPKPPST